MEIVLYQLANKTVAELATVFAGIDPKFTSMTLTWELGHKTGDELVAAFKGIPARVTSLNFRITARAGVRKATPNAVA